MVYKPDELPGDHFPKADMCRKRSNEPVFPDAQPPATQEGTAIKL